MDSLHLSPFDATRKLRRERDEAVVKANANVQAEQGKDRDETRRLLYMVLLGGTKTERWFNLAGTLTNALAHHNLGLDPREVMRRLTEIRNEENVEDNEAWAWSLIEQLTDEPGGDTRNPE